MSKKKRKKLVIWAIDPFEVEHFGAQEEAVRTLDRVVDADTVIQPVFVWAGQRLGDAAKAAEIARQADLILGRWPRPRLEARMRALRVIVAGGTVGARAKALAKYAERAKCDLVVASHHTRSALKRAFIGSFTDSLSLVAKTNLLVVPPSGPRFARVRKILFAADFSDPSTAAFGEAIRLAARSGAQLTIYHKIEGSPYYPVEFGYAAASDITEALIDDARYGLAAMKARAEKAGVKVKTVLDKRPGHVGWAIVERARRGYGLVVMAAHGKGFWDRVLIGSASRFVVRECPTAVWIFRPSGTAAARPEKTTAERAPKRAGELENYLV